MVDKDKVYNVTCPICNKTYQIHYGAWRSKQRSSDPKRFYCVSCRSKAQWASMSNEDKKKLAKQRSDAAKEKYASLPDDEKKAFNNKLTAGSKAYWNSLSPDEYVDKTKMMSEAGVKAKAVYSPEKKTAIGKKISSVKKSIFEKMGKDERRKYLENQIKATKER